MERLVPSCNSRAICADEMFLVTVKVPAATVIQYKYINKNDNGTVLWTSDPNFNFTSPETGSKTLDDTWR